MLEESVNNSGKEALLFSLAETTGQWISMSDLITHSSRYRFWENITELESDGILVRHGDLVRFKDPLLRAVVLSAKQRQSRLYTKPRMIAHN